ncbi:peptide-methionine (S)-S-oxide reductase MsrA [Candidatus Saccharibacteria bacterium]|nr:peptide-methionine (S)-S-oxide reductase MsrA [Candidatus Saccharibacteria bacterium]
MSKEVAIFGAGCFWGVQYYFDEVPGVLKTEAGYTGGHVDNPSYWDVVGHGSGHVEAVRIEFDPDKVAYETLLKHFFRIQDPTKGDMPDGINRGDNYRSMVFYTTDEQMAAAQAMIDKLNKEKYDGKVATVVTKASKWWPAEDDHQKFTARTGRGACHVDYAPVD